MGANCIGNIQSDEKVYRPTKDGSIPDRWLARSPSDDNGDDDTTKTPCAVDIPPGAWRPFNRGPRASIGQESVKLEARAILVCAVARHDFCRVRVGELVRDSMGNCLLDDKGRYQVKSELFNVCPLSCSLVWIHFFLSSGRGLAYAVFVSGV